MLTFLSVAGFVAGAAYFWGKNLSSKGRFLHKRMAEFEKQAQSKATSEYYSDSESPYLEFLRKTSIYSNLDALLMRADSSRTPEQIIFISFILFFLGIIASHILEIHFLVGILFSIILGGTPVLKLIRDEKKRINKFEEQFPDVLEFISRALQSGHGIGYAITMVGEEFPSPIGDEFRQTSEQLNFGLSFDDALTGLTSRILSYDLNFFVVSLLIQKETGGNIRDLLEVLSNTIRERAKLKGKIKTLSSEAKISANLLIGLPIGLACLFTFINYDYMSLMWTTPLGHKMLYAASIMLPLGTLWMRKIVNIKV